MATGWQDLGSLLGGGDDSSAAYDTGRLRTAQTEGALMAARATQLKNMSIEAQAKEQAQLETNLATMGVSHPAETASIIKGGVAQDYSQMMTGQGQQQENTFRDTLGDPNAPLADQFAAGQGVQGKVLSPYDFQGQNVTDLRTPGTPGAAPTIFTTPIGQSEIGAHNAQATADYARAEAALHPPLDPNKKGPGAFDPNDKYMSNPAYDPSVTDPNDPRSRMVVPVTGGPADPNIGPALGSRERAVIGRIMTAGANTANDLATWAEMPSGASQGLLGIGTGPGPKIMDAISSSMKLTLAPEEIRLYNDTLGGFSRQMQALEGMGLAGSQGQAAQFDSLAFRDKDTVLDKMFKMATVRQSVENAFGTILALNKNLPDDAKTSLQQTIDAVKRNVPYDRSDVLALVEAQRKNPRMTLGAMVKQKQLTAPVRATGAPGATAAPRGASPAAASDVPLKNDRGWDLMEDASGNKAYVSPSGEIEEVR